TYPIQTESGKGAFVAILFLNERAVFVWGLFLKNICPFQNFKLLLHRKSPRCHSSVGRAKD
ncbi:hypothetical protein, partial [Prevotellamassilia timonensis]|uniref:hypothetical protein n=1 Tax=Prevotellamassilia timonensis TaxID=1852370 RepID=UPI001F2C2645